MGDNFAELRLLTLEEVAEFLQVSKRTLHRMIHHKELPAFKVGGQWRISESRFRKWFEDKDGLISKPRLTTISSVRPEPAFSRGDVKTKRETFGELPPVKG